MRCFDGKPEPTPHEREAVFRMMNQLSDALRQVHGLEHRQRKPNNTAPDWLPPKDWTPEEEEEGESDPEF
jgi:hypothetical protein